MCSGRVDLSFVLRAFLNGMDGVFIGGCHLGECHYVTEGNYGALNMVQLCKKLMEHIGLNPDRLRLEWMSAGEGIRFASVMDDFGKQVNALGPLGKSEGLDADTLRTKLDEVTRLVPYIKIVMRDKLTSRLDTVEAYDDLYTSEDIDTLFREIVTYRIDPGKCEGCMICGRKCPVDGIEGGKKQVHTIDQEACIRCGTCFDVCPPRFAAVQRLVGVPVTEEEKA